MNESLTQDIVGNGRIMFFVGYMSDVQRIDDGSAGEDLDYSAKSFPVDPAIIQDMGDMLTAKYQIPCEAVMDLYKFIKSGKILTHIVLCGNEK